MVSIIIPVYNVAPYIEECLKSVMQQTYDGAIECLIVDDCGTDDSIPIAEQMIAEYTGPIHFEILHHEHNRGLSAARNTGTLHATGDYIYYLDSDDSITDDCIEKLMEAVNRYPEAEMVQGYVRSIPHRSYYEMDFLSDVDYIEDNKWVRKSFYRQRNCLPANAWNKLLKRSLIEEKSLLFQEGLLFEDELWMFHIVKYLSRYCIVHHPTYIHRWGRDGSIMSTKTGEKWVSHWSFILNEIVHHLDTPYYREQLLRYLGILVSIYGIDGYFPPSSIMKEYQNTLFKEHLYEIYISLIIMKITFPISRGRGFKRILNFLIKRRFNNE